MPAGGLILMMISKTLKTIFHIVQFIILEVLPFGVAIYQRISRGENDVYWPYRERRDPHDQ